MERRLGAETFDDLAREPAEGPGSSPTWGTIKSVTSTWTPRSPSAPIVSKMGSGPLAAMYRRMNDGSPLPLKSTLTASSSLPMNSTASGVMYPFVTKFANRPARWPARRISRAYSMKIVGSL